MATDAWHTTWAAMWLALSTAGPRVALAQAYHSVVVANPGPEDDTSQAAKTSGEDLRQTSAPTMLEALSRGDPGMFVTSRGSEIHGVASGSSGAIHIRGLGGSPNSQILVVEDGVPDYQGIFGHPIPDAYSPLLVRSVEVIHGGDSVLYGTNALGGVVLVHSRWPTLDGTEATFDSSYGSFDTLGIRMAVLHRAGHTDLAGAFSAHQSEGFRPGAGGRRVVAQAALRRRADGPWRVTIRDRFIRVLGADPGPLSHPNPDHWFHVLRNTLSVNLDWTAGGVSVTALPFVNVGRHLLYDGFHSTDWNLGADLRLTWRPAARVHVLLGTSVRRVDGDLHDQDLSVRPVTGWSSYGQATWRPRPGLSIVAGLRQYLGDPWGAEFLYKAGLRWDLPWGPFLRARISRNLRLPTLRELYLPFPTANPDLRPEHSITRDATVGYEGDALTLSVTVYDTAATDLIRYFGAWPTAEVVNVDHVTLRGLEASARLGLGWLSVQAGGGLVDTGRYTRQNPDRKLDLVIGLDHPVAGMPVRATLSGQWIGGLHMKDYSREPMDDFLTIDARVSARLASHQGGPLIEPYLILRDLLDRRDELMSGYPTPGLSVIAGLQGSLP